MNDLICGKSKFRFIGLENWCKKITYEQLPLNERSLNIER